MRLTLVADIFIDGHENSSISRRLHYSSVAGVFLRPRPLLRRGLGAHDPTPNAPTGYLALVKRTGSLAGAGCSSNKIIRSLNRSVSRPPPARLPAVGPERC